jgi:hypothetical protein
LQGLNEWDFTQLLFELRLSEMLTYALREGCKHRRPVMP